MFYFDGEKWKVFEKKVTYTKEVTEYENETDRFNNEKNLIITSVQLSDIELQRLEDIRDIQGLGVDDVMDYVINGIVSEYNQTLMSVKGQAEEKAEILTMLSSAPPELLVKMKSLQRPWQPDRYFSKGELVTYDEILYKVVQSHNSQEDWTPDKAVSLFAKVLTSQDETPLPWVQPDSTNPYMKGNRVIFEGKTYESTVDNNVWSPTAYPQGWKVV